MEKQAQGKAITDCQKPGQETGFMGADYQTPVLAAAGPGAAPGNVGLAEADLLRALAHDLRSPLTAISGAIEMALAAGEMGPASQKLLQGAAGEAQALISLAENILVLSRLPETAQGPALAEEAVAAAMALFRQRHPSVACSARLPEHPLWLAADGMLLRQVLLNLLENAARHGAGSVIMAAAPLGKQALFTVKDDGPGLAPELLPILFQGRGVETSRSGLGLGLRICQRIVEGLGGRIWAENDPAAGALFSFVLDQAEVGHDE